MQAHKNCKSTSQLAQEHEKTLKSCKVAAKMNPKQKAYSWS